MIDRNSPDPLVLGQTVRCGLTEQYMALYLRGCWLAIAIIVTCGRLDEARAGETRKLEHTLHVEGLRDKVFRRSTFWQIRCRRSTFVRRKDKVSEINLCQKKNTSPWKIRGVSCFGGLEFQFFFRSTHSWGARILNFVAMERCKGWKHQTL